MAGRPTDYREEYNEQAYKLCLLGATDEDMAGFFNVDESTINRWKLSHDEFCESIKRGKMLADANVADRLYKRALGFEAPDTVTASFQGVITDTKEVIKVYPPDTTAAIFWLKNRQPKQWRDSKEIDHTTKGESINSKPDLSKLTDDELRIRAEIDRKTYGA